MTRKKLLSVLSQLLHSISKLKFLPSVLENTVVTIGGKEWNGADFWTLLYVTSPPSQREKILMMSQDSIILVMQDAAWLSSLNTLINHLERMTDRKADTLITAFSAYLRLQNQKYEAYLKLDKTSQLVHALKWKLNL